MNCVAGGVWRSAYGGADYLPKCTKVVMVPSGVKAGTTAEPRIIDDSRITVPQPMPVPSQNGKVSEFRLMSGEKIHLVMPESESAQQQSSEQKSKLREPIQVAPSMESQGIIMIKPGAGLAGLPKALASSEKSSNNDDYLPQQSSSSAMRTYKKMGANRVPQYVTRKLWMQTTHLPKKQVTCGPAPDIVNGYVVDSNFKNKTVKSKPADWAQYQCIPGLTMVGDAYVICMRDGRWSTIDGTLPLCISQRLCSDPPELPSAYLEPVDHTFDLEAAQRMKIYHVGTKLRYRCRSLQADLETGDGVTQCQLDGTWTATNFNCIRKFSHVFLVFANNQNYLLISSPFQIKFLHESSSYSWWLPDFFQRKASWINSNLRL